MRNLISRTVSRCVDLWKSAKEGKLGSMNPRETQERNDLYMALLTSHYKRLRTNNKNNNDDNNKEEKQKMLDEAIRILEQDESIYKSPLFAVREKLQSQFLGPETKTIFDVFYKVENQLLLHNNNNNNNNKESKSSSSAIGKKRNFIMKDILCNEFEDVSSSLLLINSQQQDKQTRTLPFHIQKLGALKTILDYQNWISPTNTATSSLYPSSVMTDLETNNKLDEFGYDMTTFSEKAQLVTRYNQTLNLCFANLIKKELGYTTISLRSIIPNGGRGIFLDGKAYAGSIVAFFPGNIWPREHLQNMSIAPHFQKDENNQLTLRYDDILIDSRDSPCVVLSGHDNLNPWAIAHLANHPPKRRRNKDSNFNMNDDEKKKESLPNCRTIMLNFTDNMKLTPESKKYIPNVYAKPPPLLSTNAAFDHDRVYMHGMALVTTRDVENEELYYNYRFSSDPQSTTTASSGKQEEGEDVEEQGLPDWYHVCDEEEIKNRWYK